LVKLDGCIIATTTDNDPSGRASTFGGGAIVTSNLGPGATFPPLATNHVDFTKPKPNSPLFAYPIAANVIVFDANTDCAFPPTPIIHRTAALYAGISFGVY
jgi:hypothetical protein